MIPVTTESADCGILLATKVVYRSIYGVVVIGDNIPLLRVCRPVWHLGVGIAHHKCKKHRKEKTSIYVHSPKYSVSFSSRESQGQIPFISILQNYSTKKWIMRTVPKFPPKFP